MYCVVVLHISYDNRLSTARYEVTTQRHVRIAAQRWSEHRMESRRRRHAVSGSALHSPCVLLVMNDHDENDNENVDSFVTSMSYIDKTSSMHCELLSGFCINLACFWSAAATM